LSRQGKAEANEAKAFGRGHGPEGPPPLRGLNVRQSDFLYRARLRLRAQGRGAEFDQYRAAHWRLKNGLEHRCLVALLHAPELLREAQSRISPRDFLTPAYAALAAVLLESARPDYALSVARSALAGRPYLPDPVDHDWAAELQSGLSGLESRRERWRLSQHRAR
jgi:hypothetical protein